MGTVNSVGWERERHMSHMTIVISEIRELLFAQGSTLVRTAGLVQTALPSAAAAEEQPAVRARATVRLSGGAARAEGSQRP